MPGRRPLKEGIVGNQFDEMMKAVDEAEATLRIADRMANRMAKMLIGRLREVVYYDVLKNLKRELRDYNMHTCQWKGGP